MTRKDYVAIAERIAAHRQHAQDNYIGQERSITLFTLAEIANSFSAMMAQDNPRFDRQRFLKACGVQS